MAAKDRNARTNVPRQVPEFHKPLKGLTILRVVRRCPPGRFEFWNEEFCILHTI